MTILLTTSNFPDIMLPALHGNTINFLFFFSYLTLGLYFMLNVLLATIFSGYKNKLAERALEIADKRLVYLEKYFNEIDKGNKGYLINGNGEARRFFKIVCNLNFKKEEDVQTFKQIMKIVDPEDTKKIYKEAILEFFAMPGFSAQIAP